MSRGRTGKKHRRIDTVPSLKVIIKIPLELFNEMEAWCHVRGITKTEFVRQATAEKLEKSS